MKAGDWVLVHAAAGGVGLAAVQIAKAMGATVDCDGWDGEEEADCAGVWGGLCD